MLSRIKKKKFFYFEYSRHTDSCMPMMRAALSGASLPFVSSSVCSAGKPTCAQCDSLYTQAHYLLSSR